MAELNAYSVPGDRGGGLWEWRGGSTAADDGGTVVKPSGVSGAGRWERIIADGICLPYWWGARGDNSTDDTAAIQAAINRAKSNGNAGRSRLIVKLLPGVHLVSGLVIDRPVVLVGSGQQSTYLAVPPAHPEPAIRVAVSDGGYDYYSDGHPPAMVHIADLRINGGGKGNTAQAETAHGLALTNAAVRPIYTFVNIQRVTVYNVSGDALFGASGFKGGVYVEDFFFHQYGRDGVHCTGCYDWRFVRGELSVGGRHGWYLSGCSMFGAWGVYSYANREDGLFLTGAGENYFQRCMFDRNIGNGLNVDAGDVTLEDFSAGLNSRTQPGIKSDMLVSGPARILVRGGKFGHTGVSSPATHTTEFNLKFAEAEAATSLVTFELCKSSVGNPYTQSFTNNTSRLRGLWSTTQGNLFVLNLPTVAPGASGALWRDENGALRVVP